MIALALAGVIQGCAFDGAVCRPEPAPVLAIGGETELLIVPPMTPGERRLIERTIEESPTLTEAIRRAERERTWRDYYDERIVDAAVASWGSNMKAGYLKGTAAAYATFQTAPPGLNVVAGGALWAVGVVYGAALGLLASALTGHL